MDHLFICIMAGGTGERFWPMSRKSMPKHLLRLFSEESLVEETVRRVEPLVPADHIFLLTNEAQLANTREAVHFLPPSQIVAEPAKRDTAPACALGTALARARDPEAVVVFLPADALLKPVEIFRRQLLEMAAIAAEGKALMTFAIKPSYAATGFGYLEIGQRVHAQEGKTCFYTVKRFVEKPNIAKAEEYLRSGGYLWNAGMFCWRASSFLDETKRLAPELAKFIEGFPSGNFADYLAEVFPKLPKISVDYAIMEKAREVITARAEFAWDDVGTWTALPPHLGEDDSGNTVRGAVAVHDSRNNIVFAQDRTVALCGVENLIVIETADAILVCHRDAAQDIKNLHAKLPDDVL